MQGDYPSSENPAPSDTKEEIEENTALLPKSFFPDGIAEVGKTCKVKIVHVYEDEIEVEYVNAKKDESAEAQIDRMAEES